MAQDSPFRKASAENRFYAGDFLKRGIPKGERFGQTFGDFGAEAKVTRRRHKPTFITMVLSLLRSSTDQIEHTDQLQFVEHGRKTTGVPRIFAALP